MDDHQNVAVVDQVRQFETNSMSTDDNESQQSSKEIGTSFVEASSLARTTSDGFHSGSAETKMHNENLTEKEKRKQMNAVRWRRWWEKNRKDYNRRRRVAFKRANPQTYAVPVPIMPQIARCSKRTASGGYLRGTGSEKLVTFELPNNTAVQGGPIPQQIVQTDMHPSRIAMLSPAPLVAPSLPTVVGSTVYMAAPQVAPRTPVLSSNIPMSIGHHANMQTSHHTQVPFHMVPLSVGRVAGQQQSTSPCLWVNVQQEPSAIVSNSLPFVSSVRQVTAVQSRPSELVWAPELALAMRSTQ